MVVFLLLVEQNAICKEETSGVVTYATVTAGLCLIMASWSSGGSDGGGGDETALVVITGDGRGARSRRFVIVNGDGVPDYDYGDDYDPGHDTGGGGGGGGGHDYDDWYPDIDLDDEHHHHHHDDDDDDDDDFDFGHYGHGFHHVWWHHFYHHDEPHLPFPLFPPFFVHRLRPVYRRLRRSCNEWPFVCHNAYEVVQWLQCYHEFLGGSLRVDKFHHGVPVVPVHAWRKK